MSNHDDRPDYRELVEAATALVNHWDTPDWDYRKPHTAGVIAKVRQALSRLDAPDSEPEAKEPTGQKDEKPDYKWLAMDGGGSWVLFENRPSLDQDGDWIQPSGSVSDMADSDGKPSWLKPGQLWDRAGGFGKVISEEDFFRCPFSEPWNGYWWRLAEDHSAKDSYVPHDIMDDAMAKISDLEAENARLRETLETLAAEYLLFRRYGSIKGYVVEREDKIYMDAINALRKPGGEEE